LAERGTGESLTLRSELTRKKPGREGRLKGKRSADVPELQARA